MRLKVDENLHDDVAVALRERGHDVRTVFDQGLRGRSDSVIAEICQKESRTLITLDLDFADIRAYPPDQYPGFMVLRVGDQSRKHVMEVILGALGAHGHEATTGRLWIIEDHRVRIRGGD